MKNIFFYKNAIHGITLKLDLLLEVFLFNFIVQISYLNFNCHFES